MFKSKLIDYHYDVTLQGHGIRRLTIPAYGPSHARWKAEEQLKAAGFVLLLIVPAPHKLTRTS